MGVAKCNYAAEARTSDARPPATCAEEHDEVVSCRVQIAPRHARRVTVVPERHLRVCALAIVHARRHSLTRCESRDERRYGNYDAVWDAEQPEIATPL